MLYAALTAIIDCTQNSTASLTTVIPLTTMGKLSSSIASTVAEDGYGSGDGQSIASTLSALQNDNRTTESTTVTIHA